MFRPEQSDTAEPHNLLDEDIHEDMHELPPARPESIRTPVQYFVAKNRLILVSGRISDLNALTQAPRYEEILRLDEDLNRARDSIPPYLAMVPMSKSIMDDPSVIIQRMYLALVFNKAKIMLHRSYLITAKTRNEYAYSRSIDIGAAMEILRIQQLMDQETQPGGRLHANRGRVTSNLRSDFLLAATILCVDLDHSITYGRPDTAQHAASGTESAGTVIEALQQAYQTWARSSDSSREAQRAVRALKIVLNKIRAGPYPQDTDHHAELQQSSPMLGTAVELTAALPPTTAISSVDSYWAGSDLDSFLGFSDLNSGMASICSCVRYGVPR